MTILVGKLPGLVEVGIKMAAVRNQQRIRRAA